MVNRKPHPRGNIIPPEQQAAEHKRLRRVWAERKKEMGTSLTQAAVAREMGVSNAHVNQMFQGKLPISERALIAFSKVLGIDPDRIRPGFWDELDKLDRKRASRVDKLAVRLRQADEETRQMILAFAERLLDDR